MDIAGKLMDMASRVLKPDHYWKGMPSPQPPLYDPLSADQDQ
jgi:hypothetical protein